MTKYRIYVEQKPLSDLWRAVAYQVTTNTFGKECETPIRIVGDGPRDFAEFWATGLRVRYGLEGCIVVFRNTTRTGVQGRDDAYVYHWLFEDDDNKIVEHWLQRNEYQLVERDQDAIDYPDTHYLCGVYRKV
jgi:hypothetical protein